MSTSEVQTKTKQKVTSRSSDENTKDQGFPSPRATSKPEADSDSRSEVGAESTSQEQRSTVGVDDSEVVACYANFCRVSATPEELILDLGLNSQPMNPENETVKVSQRTILNHYTAKRLLSALSVAVQRHEKTFGVLETDVRRRVRPR